MAKKQFIRHLEFYGFPDQNAFVSETDIPSSEGKADKKDLDALSAQTEVFISAQTEFNEAQRRFNEDVESDISALTEGIDTIGSFIASISGISDDVEALSSEIDEERSRAISAETALNDKIDNEIADVRNDVKDYIKTKVKKYVDDADAELQGQIDVIDNNLIIIDEQYSGLSENLNENYYTKEEIDEKIASGISSYVTIEQLNTVYDELQENIDEEIVRAISAETALSGAIEDERDRAISAETALNNKIDNEIADVRSDVKTYITTKVKKYIDDADGELQDQINNKSDKSDVSAISGVVDTIESDLDVEIARAKEAEQSITDIVESAVTKVETYETRVSDLEIGLSNEIANREQGDLDIIGTSSDTRDDSTIYGAKKYAEEMKRQAVSDSEVYTDEKVSVFQTMVDNLSAETQQWLSSAATTGYVESRITNTKSGLQEDIAREIGDERNRAKGEESVLQNQINAWNYQIVSATTEISNNSTRINAITSWKGSDPSEYVSGGTGVLDILHKEFHELINTLYQKGILP